MGKGEALLAHLPGIALWQQIGEAELAFRCEVPLNEQDDA